MYATRRHDSGRHRRVGCLACVRQFILRVFPHLTSFSSAMGRTKTHGWPEPFRPRPWKEIDAFLGDMADRHVQFRYMADIVQSVLASDDAQALAGCISMHDLIVVPTPIPVPPYGVVAVRALGSLHEPGRGLVRIEHLSVTGHGEKVDKPIADSVPLFWRFMIEKFGIDPGTREGSH